MTKYTLEECQKLFLDHLWELIDYWDTVDSFDGHPRTQRDRLSGLVHSILATIDGESGDMPAFMLIPSPHEDDKEWYKARGDDWWPEDMCDIGGPLHELLYRDRQ